MKKSIFLKILSGYLLITVILAGVTWIFFYQSHKRFINDDLSRSMEQTASALEPIVTEYISNNDLSGLEKKIKALSQKINSRISVILTNGAVAADSHASWKSMDNHSNRPEVMGAMSGTIATSFRYSATMKKRMLYLALPVKKGSDISFILRLSMFSATISGLLRSHKYHMMIAIMVFVSLTLIASLIISSSLTSPLRELCKAGKLMSEGSFKGKVLLPGADEVSELASSFNSMNEQLRMLFSDLSAQRDQLESIIESISEGFILINSKGNITIYNETFLSITDEKDLTNRLFYEVINSSELIRAINNVLKEETSLSVDLKMGDEYYRANICFLERSRDIAVIFNNISKQKQTEQIKKDIAQNVSHELRTPLTSIKGFAETLEDELADESQLQYIKIIKRNTERLINIVNDLLTLNELESRQFTLELAPTDLKELITQVVNMLKPKILVKKISLNLMLEDEIPVIQADSFRLEQALINLIDNAIRYTEKGQISVKLVSENNNIYIHVSDTGLGIPPEHRDRIFERFYVTDKSRSRKLGGTGLGLSIVKHIVNLHGGEVTYKSAQKGTVFTVKLSINS